MKEDPLTTIKLDKWISKAKEDKDLRVITQVDL